MTRLVPTVRCQQPPSVYRFDERVDVCMVRPASAPGLIFAPTSSLCHLRVLTAVDHMSRGLVVNLLLLHSSVKGPTGSD
ncbi:hypothetical protein BaRGS_00003554 [Batillaria attramentaria]|uniref:Uncharacterized protein n=1 Tax=Batillaria attramentaria TaxID=370345 RepID=A0ABD0M2F5_9CAEN